MIFKVKVNGKFFEIKMLDLEISKIIREFSNWDFETKIDNDRIFVKFGVDRMWISVDSIVIMVKPKTYSIDDIRSIVRKFLSKITLHDM